MANDIVELTDEKEQGQIILGVSQDEAKAQFDSMVELMWCVTLGVGDFMQVVAQPKPNTSKGKRACIKIAKARTKKEKLVHTVKLLAFAKGEDDNGKDSNRDSAASE